MLVNSIGLEGEFFLKNKQGDLVFPKDHGFPYDNFILLGEIRGLPGKSREETVSNFLKEYYRLKFLAAKKDLVLEIGNGWTMLDAKFYSNVVKKIEEKSVPKCQNIYEHDLSTYSDSIVKDGKLMSHKVSIGLHVHFSSQQVARKEIVTKNYEPVKLPLNISSIDTFLNVFVERGGESKTIIESVCSRLTKPAIHYIVEQMDKKLHKQFVPSEPLRYRLPGFYEMKDDGRFEYRSLPFSEAVLENIPQVADYSYELLENL